MSRHTDKMEEWIKLYPGGVPAKVIQSYLHPSRLDYVLDTFTLCPVTGKVVNKRTGRVNQSARVQVGKGRPPVTPIRIQWMVLKSTDPYRVGRDEKGMFAVQDEGGDREYLSGGV